MQTGLWISQTLIWILMTGGYNYCRWLTKSWPYQKSILKESWDILQPRKKKSDPFGVKNELKFREARCVHRANVALIFNTWEVQMSCIQWLSKPCACCICSGFGVPLTVGHGKTPECLNYNGVFLLLCVLKFLSLLGSFHQLKNDDFSWTLQHLAPLCM